MIKIMATVIVFSLSATMADAQTYTNRDPATGARDRGTIYVTAEKTTAEKTTKKVPTLPQSFIDGQYKPPPTMPDAYALANRYQVLIIPYDPDPFSSSVRLENPTPLPSQYPYYMPTQYFGSFAPLTPYGPLVNTALFPTMPTIRRDRPSPRRPTPRR